MITFRPMTTAFILHGESILMIKRSIHKKIHPGKWAGVGGHIEMQEFKEPRDACLREIKEETGLKETDLSSLQLRYIVLSRKTSELRQQFIYFGNSFKLEIHSTVEGELKWISKKDILNLTMPPTHQVVLGHYLNSKPNDTGVLVGTSTTISGKHQVQWHLLESVL